MNSGNLKVYCVTNKKVDFINKPEYYLSWVGTDETPKNYISCNVNVKSEIVIPILVDQENIGQIDVDSNLINPFTKNDVELLEFVCNKIALKIKTLKYGLD